MPATKINSKAFIIINNLYYNTKLPSSFTGRKNLWSILRNKYPFIKYYLFTDWHRQQRTYTLHKPAIRKFKRSKIVAENIDEQWQADLVDLKEFDIENDKNKYLLTIVDVLSKYAFVVPLLSQNSIDVYNAFKNILKIKVPQKIQTDKGTEFYNNAVSSLFREWNVHHFSSNNSDIKCANVLINVLIEL